MTLSLQVIEGLRNHLNRSCELLEQCWDNAERCPAYHTALEAQKRYLQRHHILLGDLARIHDEVTKKRGWIAPTEINRMSNVITPVPPRIADRMANLG